MNIKFMRVVLFFDLPRETSKERGLATKFVKNLKKEGFIMLQESVYCKLLLSSSSFDFIKKRIEQIKPSVGNIMLLTVTEKQFNSIEIILGDSQKTIVDSTSRLVII